MKLKKDSRQRRLESGDLYRGVSMNEIQGHLFATTGNPFVCRCVKCGETVNWYEVRAGKVGIGDCPKQDQAGVLRKTAGNLSGF